MTKLRDVYLRRYNLRRSALEFFLMDQSNYFLNFTTKVNIQKYKINYVLSFLNVFIILFKIRLKVLTSIYSVHPPNFSFNSSRHPQDLLRKSGCTQKWVNREISNFEYLMQVSILLYSVSRFIVNNNQISDSTNNYFVRPAEHHSRPHLQ